jgi:hypothetical protein
MRALHGRFARWLNGANPFEYLTEFAAALRGVEAKPIGVDAETMARMTRPAAAQYDESCLAEKDPVRPRGSGRADMVVKRASEKTKSGKVLATHESSPKCFAAACMPACTPKADDHTLAALMLLLPERRKPVLNDVDFALAPHSLRDEKAFAVRRYVIIRLEPLFLECRIREQAGLSAGAELRSGCKGTPISAPSCM